jgi:hypothetical protein
VIFPLSPSITLILLTYYSGTGLLCIQQVLINQGAIMKNVFFILTGILVISASAHAQAPDASEAESIKNCVGVMRGNPKVTQAQAEYACDNMYLEPRATDTKEQEAMRQELAADAAIAKEEMQRQYHSENPNQNN